MLYYLLFWTLLGFIIHFYITFGTNLLTGGPAQIVVFLPISVFRRKVLSNGVQTEWNLRERDFWNEHDLEDLDPTSEDEGGAHEGRGRALHPRGQLGTPLACTPSPSSWFPSKINFTSWFHSVLTPYDIPFPRNTEIGIKQQIWAGPPVNRLVPKII